MSNVGTSDHWINDTTYMYSCFNIINSERDIRVYTIDTAMRFYKQLTLGKPDTSDHPAYRTSMAYANDSTVYIGGFIQKIEFYPTNPNPVEIYLIDTGLNLLGYIEYGWDANYDVWGMVATADNPLSRPRLSAAVTRIPLTGARFTPVTGARFSNAFLYLYQLPFSQTLNKI